AQKPAQNQTEDASKTAKPRLTAQGKMEEAEQRESARGEWIKNYLMEILVVLRRGREISVAGRLRLCGLLSRNGSQ
ncbi:hypothetical protein ACOIDL_28320, partial [Klebsiella pneumoniae]